MEFFQHPDGRLIVSVQYRCDCGASIRVAFDAAGHEALGQTSKEDGKPVITAKPGDWLINGGQRWQVASLFDLVTYPPTGTAQSE